jgi:hypothetical protein
VRRVVVAAIAASLLSLGSAAAVAGNEPNGHASCMGIELSATSPPGSSDEVPGGAPDLMAGLQGLAGAVGLPVGRVISLFIAPLHAGSHEACDEALGG